MLEPKELEGKNYRVRMITLKLSFDVYDDMGMLQDRNVTQDIIITESQFPSALVSVMANATGMARGFAALTSPPPVAPESGT
jgi:hypothetical protein